MSKLLLTLLLCSNLAYAGMRVEVEAQGATLDSAKKNAFRKAIEQAVGVVVISDQEVEHDQLTKDFIGNYSSGFVEDYEIIESSQGPDGLWLVHMNAKIATNKIAERMMDRAQKTNHVNGSKISDRLASQIEMFEHGDALLSNVLSSYPEHAYIINSGDSTFKINRLRQPYVDIPYSLTMSKFWVEAFNDSVKQVAVDSKSCNTLTMSVAQTYEANPRYGNTTKDIARSVCGKDPDIRIFFKASGDYIPKSYSYYLPDQVTLDTINQQLQSSMGQQHIGLKVDLIDDAGGIIDSRCARINNQLLVYYTDPVGAYNLRNKQKLSHPNIMGQNKINGTLRLQLNDPYQIQNLSQIKLSVQQTCS